MIDNLGKLQGGIGDTTPSHDVNPNELSIGVQVEMEHTNDPRIAQEIVMDHLTEDPAYYTKLIKAGLAKEFQPTHNSGFGDPDYSFNDAARTGRGGLKKGNMHGKMGGTPDGKVHGRNSEPIINKTVDIELDEKKGKKKPKPTNPALWARAKAAARAKFDVYPCVPLDSKALTKNGWKSYDELTIGELILTYNINRDELEWKPILNLNFFENAELVRMYKPTGFSIKCTPNHKWVVQRGNDYSTVELIETKDLPKRARIIMCAELKNNDKILLENFSKTDNWTENVINMSSEQRKSFLAASIIYDGWDKGSSSKIEGRHTFGFVQKNSDHLDAGLLAAYLSGYYVSVCDREYITSANFIRNKKFHSAQNIKFEKTESEDVWCPTTENNTWVMYQNGLITITGNSAYANGWAAKWYKSKGGGWRMSEDAESSPIRADDGPFPAQVSPDGQGTYGSGYDFVGFAENKGTIMKKEQLKEAIKRLVKQTLLEQEQDDVDVAAEDETVTITLDKELAQKLHDLLMTQLQPEPETETPAGPEDANAVVPSEDEGEATADDMSSDQLPVQADDEEAVDEITFEESEAMDEAKKKWIQKAVKKPGALHKQLGVPAGEKIPSGKLAAAAKKGGKMGQRARLAQTLSKIAKTKKK